MNKPSALETALFEFSNILYSWLRSIDRAVAVAFLLSLVPIPPACWVGVLLSVANIILIKLKKIAANEAKIVYVSLLIGIINSILGTILIGSLAEFFVGNFVNTIFKFLPDFLHDLIFDNQNLFVYPDRSCFKFRNIT